MPEVWSPETVMQGAPAWTTAGFFAGPGIADLRVEDGKLKGRVTQAQAMLWVGREARGRAGDPVHSVQVRMRVDRGENLYFHFQGSANPDPEQAQPYWRGGLEHLRVPLQPGSMQDYVYEPRDSVWMNDIGAVLLSPSDEIGAEFEIESLRLVAFSEHLAEIPTGIGWRGARGVWMETITTRAPQRVSYDVVVPARGWLDLSVSLVSGGPASFRVEVDGETSFDQNIEQVDRWFSAPVELAQWAGKSVELSLVLESKDPATVGLWGSPVVRARLPEPKPGRAEPTPRGVIVFLADTLRPDHLSLWGYERETTLALPKLAQQGVLFRDCSSQATWTLPSTVSLVTSLYPSSHGVVGMGNAVPHAAETMAEVFREAGYATVAYSAVKFTGRFTSFHQGFEVLHEAEFGAPDHPSKSAEHYVNRLLPWLAQHKDDRFFVFLHVYDPHDPYKPRSPFDTQWADAEGLQEHVEQSERVKPFIQDQALERIGLPVLEELVEAGVDPEEWVDYEKDWYDGSILGMDREIARLMTQLRELGLLESTLFVFTSDHGEEFLEHGRTWHGQGLYSELTQVPLLFFGAGVPARGAVIDAPVGLIDVMPTVLEACDLRAPSSMQGQSLLPLIQQAAGVPVPEGAWTPRPVVAEKAALSGERSSPPPQEAGMLAIQNRRWKLIHNEPRVDDRPEWELFDRQGDPFDQTNVADQHPDVVARLRAQLQEWRERTAGVRLEAGTAGMDAETLQKLREMGYAK